MTSIGSLKRAIIFVLEIVIFACLKELPLAGVFYLAKTTKPTRH